METTKLRKRLIRISCLECSWTNLFRTTTHGVASYEEHRKHVHPNLFDAIRNLTRVVTG